MFRDYSSVSKIAAGTASVPQMFCVLCGWGVFRGGRVWSFSGQWIICDGRSPHDSPLTQPLTPNTSHTVLPPTEPLRDWRNRRHLHISEPNSKHIYREPVDLTSSRYHNLKLTLWLTGQVDWQMMICVSVEVVWLSIKGNYKIKFLGWVVSNSMSLTRRRILNEHGELHSRNSHRRRSGLPMLL